ncbi:MAG: proton-conducting transporter membrane subunit [Hyphomonadaceae bacterium]|nr:proton-conducting transporter membrane subunit [Hyphomonadaceae bacterium]
MTDAIELIRANAPLLGVGLPLFGAALMLAAPGARSAWALASLTMLATATVAVDLAMRLASGAPFLSVGAGLRPDGVGVWAFTVQTCLATLVAIGAGAMLREFHQRAAPFAFALFLVMVAAWNAAALSASFIGFAAAVETAWLAGVGVAALHGDRDRGALSGALRMLTAGGVAGALLLVGAALTVRGAGADLTALTEQQPPAPGAAALGMGMMIAALALKAGVAPLHAWTGPAFGRVGGFGALALGAIGVVAALFALLRVSAYAMAAPAIAVSVSHVLLTLGVISVVIPSMQAVGAVNVRRLAAYAAAAQAGCVLVSAALGSPAGFAAALVQITALGIAAMALFGGAASLGQAHGLDALDGLARRAPLSALAVTAGALSVMGAPLTLGFLGRWRLIEAGVGGGWWWAAGAVIVVSLAAVFYAGRLIERVYFRRAGAAAVEPNLWRLTLGPALVAATLAIGVGLEPSLLLRAADAAAALATGPAP